MSSWLRRRWPHLLLALFFLGLLGLLLAANPTHDEPGASQERLDQAAGPIAPGHAVGQTIFSERRGLKRVEILLVVYDAARQLPPDAQLTLTLQRVDGTGTPVRVSVPAAGLTHNQRLAFDFGPLPDSRAVAYTLTLECAADYGLSCWQTEGEAYAGGAALLNGAPQPGDLYFTTTYAYHLTDALRDLAAMLWSGLPLVPALTLLLMLPGLVLLLYLWPREKPLDLPTYAALALALSVAFWPLLLLWTTTLGLRLRGGWVWAPVGLLAAAGVARLWTLRNASSGDERVSEPDHPLDDGNGVQGTSRAPLYALALVLAVVFAVRILNVRDLLVPPWVDSVHHTVVTQLIAEQGQIPRTGEPYLQLADYHYHYGFQANAAVLMGLSGLAAPQAVLVLGQVFNALTVLMVYVLARWLMRRRWAGVAAALVAGLVSNMPAYYLSWGRYTQLAGLLLLPMACLATTWLLMEPRRSARLWVLTGLLVAGLVVVHYRVLVFYGLYCLVYGLIAIGRGRWRWPAARRVVGMGLGLTALGVVLALPWVLRLTLRVLPNVDAIYAGWESPQGYNEFPLGMLRSGWTRQILVLAGAGALWGLVRRKALVVGLAAWVGLWLLAANLHLVGLVDVWLLNNASVFIALWLPVSMLCGWLVADVPGVFIAWLERLTTRGAGKLQFPWRRLATLVACALVAVATAWLGWRMVDAVNPVTVLLFPDDLQAITWARDALPADARVLVNTRQWEGEIHVGSDGGWWMPLLAGRDVTMPSILYHQGPAAYREAITSLATLVEQAPSVDDPALLARLVEERVTHVYVGVRGGRLMPKELDASPHYRALYVSGPTRIYEFVP